jgi:pyrimidine operon attenuation protein / uracil phosphoribosyltransferase
MQRRLLLDNQQLDITLQRLCQQLIENHDDFENTVLLGMQPRGILLSDRIHETLNHLTGIEVPAGYLDATFHRDDFRRREAPLKANATRIPFIIENKKVILVDDVLYTGRTIRAALDAMNAFGRPAKVELLVLINRKYTRDLPIEAMYVGRNVNSIQSQKVLVEWKAQGAPNDQVWLLDQ